MNKDGNVPEAEGREGLYMGSFVNKFSFTRHFL